MVRPEWPGFKANPHSIWPGLRLGCAAGCEVLMSNRDRISPVPAEGQLRCDRPLTILRDSSLKLFVTGVAPPQRGQVVNRHTLQYNRWRIQSFLARLCSGKHAVRGKKDLRARMLMRALGIASRKRQLFVSARYLAAATDGNEKTWDRTLAQLRGLDLIEQQRTYLTMGRQSVLLLDLSKLWAHVLTLMNRAKRITRTVVEQVGAVTWVKVGPEWRILTVGPPDAAWREKVG